MRVPLLHVKSLSALEITTVTPCNSPTGELLTLAVTRRNRSVIYFDEAPLTDAHKAKASDVVLGPRNRRLICFNCSHILLISVVLFCWTVFFPRVWGTSILSQQTSSLPQPRNTSFLGRDVIPPASPRSASGFSSQLEVHKKHPRRETSGSYPD